MAMLRLKADENKKITKKLPPAKKNPGPLQIKFYAFLCEITWQVLVKGYLTSFLFVYQLIS